MTQRLCLTLDLKDEADAIARYEALHRPGVTPRSVVESLRAGGITQCEIWRLGARLVMIIDADETFSMENQAALNKDNVGVQAWNVQMEKLQKDIEGQPAGWRPMSRLFRLGDH